jgi:hypothetical protein
MQSIYRRHERWWATPVVKSSKLAVSSMKSSKLVVSSMKLTKRVAGFVWKHAQYIPAEKLRLGGPGQHGRIFRQSKGLKNLEDY